VPNRGTTKREDNPPKKFQYKNSKKQTGICKRKRQDKGVGNFAGVTVEKIMGGWNLRTGGEDTPKRSKNGEFSWSLSHTIIIEKNIRTQEEAKSKGVNR